jgi:hypothetical protein
LKGLKPPPFPKPENPVVGAAALDVDDVREKPLKPLKAPGFSL